MKAYRQLTQKQRYIIEDLFALGKTCREIAIEAGVHFSTVARELKRNCNSKGTYRAKGAQQFAIDRRTNAYDSRRKIDGLLEQVVIEKLCYGWSPKLISGRLKLEERWDVSHETIYKWIYRFRPGLKSCLRHASRKRRRRGNRRKQRALNKYPRKLIDERSNAANERTEFGHWERDLVEGLKGSHALLVLNDRKSRLTKIARVENHFAEHVNEKTQSVLRDENCRSMTNDNGIEFGQYEDLEAALKAPVYYCHAYTSWERGTVENTNGLIRHFFKKKTDFSKISDEEVRSLENNINLRPRVMFNYRTAHEIHYETELRLIKEKTQLYKDRNRRLEEEFRESLIDAGVALAD